MQKSLFCMSGYIVRGMERSEKDQIHKTRGVTLYTSHLIVGEH